MSALLSTNLGAGPAYPPSLGGVVKLWLAPAFAADGLLAGCSGIGAAVVLLGEGAAVEVAVSAVLGVFAMGAAGTGVGLGAGSATGGLDCLGNGPGLLELATRFDGLFVDFATVGSCVGEALAGARLDASPTEGLTDATLGAALSSAAPVLASAAGDDGLDSVTFETAGAIGGAVPEGENNSAAPITIATIAPKTMGKCFTESSFGGRQQSRSDRGGLRGLRSCGQNRTAPTRPRL